MTKLKVVGQLVALNHAATFHLLVDHVVVLLQAAPGLRLDPALEEAGLHELNVHNHDQLRVGLGDGLRERRGKGYNSAVHVWDDVSRHSPDSGSGC